MTPIVDASLSSSLSVSSCQRHRANVIVTVSILVAPPLIPAIRVRMCARPLPFLPRQIICLVLAPSGTPHGASHRGQDSSRMPHLAFRNPPSCSFPVTSGRFACASGGAPHNGIPLATGGPEGQKGHLRPMLSAHGLRPGPILALVGPGLCEPVWLVLFFPQW